MGRPSRTTWGTLLFEGSVAFQLLWEGGRADGFGGPPSQALLNSQIVEVDNKIAGLDAIREGLRRSLLTLREEELELEDERAFPSYPFLCSATC